MQMLSPLPPSLPPSPSPSPSPSLSLSPHSLTHTHTHSIKLRTYTYIQHYQIWLAAAETKYANPVKLTSTRMQLKDYRSQTTYYKTNNMQ